jgi:energy-coupling factor transporter transmembrane protein EcfT
LASFVSFFGFIVLAFRTGYDVPRYGAGPVGVADMLVLSTLVLGALLVGGAVAALMGRKRTLVVVSVLQAIVCLAAMVVPAAIGIENPNGGIVQSNWFERGVFGLIFLVPILILILQRSSRDFFRTATGSPPAANGPGRR